MDYMSVRDASALWGISERWIQKYCEDGRIDGVQRFGRSWMIPNTARKPMDKQKGCKRIINTQIDTNNGE